MQAVTEGIKNLTTRERPRLEIPPPVGKNPLEGHDVAVYVDGKRISTTYMNIETDSGDLVIYAETTLEAALDPTVDALISKAWCGFKPLDMIGYSAATNLPAAGSLQIIEMLPPSKEGEDAIFICTAMSDVWNLKTSEKIASAGDQVEIYSRYARRQQVAA